MLVVAVEAAHERLGKRLNTIVLRDAAEKVAGFTDIELWFIHGSRLRADYGEGMNVKAFVAAAVVLAVPAVAFAVDAATAAKVERHLAVQARAHDNLPAEPDTYVGGFPFAQVLRSNEVPRVSFEALDVDAAGLTVNSRTDIYEISIPADKAYAGDFVGAAAKRVDRTLSMDGVAFGELLHMTDLDISNPYDISPTGGSASEAQLTGTVPGMDEKSTVVVTLRLRGSQFIMEPISLIDVSPTHADTISRAFTLTLDTRDLPIGDQADKVEVAGGSIRFSAAQRNVTLSPTDLSPIAAPAR